MPFGRVLSGILLLGRAAQSLIEMKMHDHEGLLVSGLERNEAGQIGCRSRLMFLFAALCKGGILNLQNHNIKYSKELSMRWAGAMVDAARGTGLVPTSVVDIGPHYATTLRQWRGAWEANKGAILALKQTERFWRKFR